MADSNKDISSQAAGVFRSQRSDSSSSTGSFGSRASFGSRRGSLPQFESLQQLKRKDDPASLARRQSIHEQRPPPGLFGSMWNTWVRGAPPK